MLTLAKTIATQAQTKGWQVYIVGGYVRDQILGIDSKDIDLDVYGATPQELSIFLQQFGEVNAVGMSFGVFKLKVDGIELDVSVPRRESKRGRGHKGFMVEHDKDMTIEDGSLRRDFTMNALSMNPLTDEVIDLYKGIDHLKAGMIKATSPAFKDDPLRVLRGMQFCGRFRLDVIDPETIEMCKIVRSEYDTLSIERVWIEWEKWALKSVEPSLGLLFLQQVEWLELYPELDALVGLEQDPEWHPEGGVFAHTCHSVDKAVEVAIRDDLSKEDRLVLVFASLLHDVGKPECTTHDDNGHIRSKQHDKMGGPLAEKFLLSIGAPAWLIEQVVPLVQEHMVHVHNREPNKRYVQRLSVRLGEASIAQLMRLIEVDHSARPPLDPEMPIAATMMIEIAQELQIENEKPKPILMGRHLIEFGLSPGPEFGEYLREAYQVQLDGGFDDLESGLAWLKLVLYLDGNYDCEEKCKMRKIYVAIAYRWGDRKAHSYPVAISSRREKVETAAFNEVNYRGDKYSVQVYGFNGARVEKLDFFKALSLHDELVYTQCKLLRDILDWLFFFQCWIIRLEYTFR